MATIQVCGIAVRAYGEKTYGGGNIYPGAREIGRHTAISKASAKKLLKSLFDHERLPRPGYEIKLCDDQYLSQRSRLDASTLNFEVVRRASGPFAGTQKRRKRRRR